MVFHWWRLKSEWATAAPHHRRAAPEGQVPAHHLGGPPESHVHDVIITKEAPNYRLE